MRIRHHWIIFFLYELALAQHFFSGQIGQNYASQAAPNYAGQAAPNYQPFMGFGSGNTGRPEHNNENDFTANLCDTTVRLACSEDISCNQLSQLRSLNKPMRCIRFICTEVECERSKDCQEGQFCSLNGTCASVVFVGLNQTCNYLGGIRCSDQYQCDVKKSICIPALKEGNSCDIGGKDLLPPCPEDFSCVQWDTNGFRCIKDLLYLRQLGQTCSDSEVSSPYARCAGGLVCLNGTCIHPKVSNSNGICDNSCNSSLECRSSLCFEGRCVDNTVPVGKSCLSSKQCLSRQCTDGICTGADCTTIACPDKKICSFDLSTNKFVCVDDPELCTRQDTFYFRSNCERKPVEGESCTPNEIPCSKNLYCETTNKTCLASPSLNKSCGFRIDKDNNIFHNCSGDITESCSCVGSQQICKIDDGQKNKKINVPHGEACVKFLSEKPKIYHNCMKELIRISPATSFYDIYRLNLTNCMTYLSNYYCCLTCLNIEEDLINGADMSQLVQSGLPGLQCNPKPKWNPNEETGPNGECLMGPYLNPQPKLWYKDQICGNFLENFGELLNDLKGDLTKEDQSKPEQSQTPQQFQPQQSQSQLQVTQIQSQQQPQLSQPQQSQPQSSFIRNDHTSTDSKELTQSSNGIITEIRKIFIMFTFANVVINY